MDLTSTLKQLWHVLPKRRQIQFSLLILFTVVASFAEVFSIATLVPFLTVLTKPDIPVALADYSELLLALGVDDRTDLIVLLTGLLVCAATVAAAIRIGLLYAQIKFSYGVGAHLSFLLFKGTLHLPYEIHATKASSDHIAAITTKSSAVVGNVVMPSLAIMTAVIIGAAVFFTVVFVNPTIALGTFCGFLFIYTVIGLLAKNTLVQQSKLINEKQSAVVRVVQEGFGSIRNVILDGSGQAYEREFLNADLPLRYASAKVQLISGLPRFCVEAAGLILMAIIAALLAITTDNFADSFPALGAIALGAQRLLPLAQAAYAGVASIQGGKASLEEVLAMIKETTHVRDDDHPDRAEQPPLSWEQCVEFVNISFKYSGGTTDVLSNVSLRIEKGSKIGFKGRTGAGKSTAIDLLMGLLYPVKGKMMVDGVEIVQSAIASWQRNISHVPQSIFLPDRTIAENIAFDVLPENVVEERLQECARIAQIHDEILSLKDGYQTKVGEQGNRLSGGQRQRLGIARALYKGGNVLVLDEATSALDTDTEAKLLAALSSYSAKLTVVMIAHSDSTLRQCDQIYEVKDGKILLMAQR